MKYLVNIIIILLILFAFFANGNQIYATGIMEQAKNFIELGENGDDPFGENLATTNTHFEDLAGFVWGIGVGVALIATVVMGMKLMLASTSERAEYKKEMVPYIIGITIIFGGLTIWRVLIQILESGI